MRLRNVSFLTVLLFGLCGLVSLSWYTAFSSSRGDVVDIYQREFLALRERLHSAEQENLREKTPKYHRTEDGFIRIGNFQNGIAEGEVDPTFGPLEAMRLSVMTDSPVWVILSEVRTPGRVTGTRLKPTQDLYPKLLPEL
uniref:Alpha-1,3-mannosyl-glycoprotein 4-beta-N-acetylglucosaminyltransferase B n=1 Tax=Dicentrarchus labrax TaxID=13489 RepID=A0A8P4KJH9_DICLA